MKSVEVADFLATVPQNGPKSFHCKMLAQLDLVTASPPLNGIKSARTKCFQEHANQLWFFVCFAITLFFGGDKKC